MIALTDTLVEHRCVVHDWRVENGSDEERAMADNFPHPRSVLAAEQPPDLSWSRCYSSASKHPRDGRIWGLRVSPCTSRSNRRQVRQLSKFPVLSCNLHPRLFSFLSAPGLARVCRESRKDTKVAGTRTYREVLQLKTSAKNSSSILESRVAMLQLFLSGKKKQEVNQHMGG